MQDLAHCDAGQEATWRERALNAEDALKAAHAEIVQQRERIGELLGHVRDLEAEWTQDAIQRITTENTTLKQRVRSRSRCVSGVLELQRQQPRLTNSFCQLELLAWK